MTTTWKVDLKSLSLSHAVPPNPKEVTLSWTVRKLVSGVETTFDPFTGWVDTWPHLPRAGQKLTGWLAGTTSSDWSDYFRCRGTRWSYLTESKSVWSVEARFTSRDSWCPEPHVFRTDQVQFRSVDMYRDLVPTTAMLESTASQHTAQTGNRIDVKGQPIQKEISQQVTNISFEWNTSIVTTGNGYPNIYQLISENWTRCRNSDPFLGWPAGTARLAGLSIDPSEDEYVRVVYQFLFDPWGFMTQEPELISAGQPGALPVATQATAGVLNAHPVYWKQTYTTLKDFNELLTQAEQDWLMDGWRTFDSTNCTTPETAALTTKPSEAQVGAAAAIREYPAEEA